MLLAEEYNGILSMPSNHHEFFCVAHVAAQGGTDGDGVVMGTVVNWLLPTAMCWGNLPAECNPQYNRT